MLEHDVNRIEKFSNCICRSLHCHCSQGTFCWVSTSTSLTPFWVAHATKGPRHRTQLIGPSPKWSVACFASWNGRITGKSKIWKYQIKQWNQTESTCFGTGAKYAADVVLVTTYTSFCLCQIFPVHARYLSRCSCDCLKMPCKVYMSGNLDCAGLQKKWIWLSNFWKPHLIWFKTLSQGHKCTTPTEDKATVLHAVERRMCIGKNHDAYISKHDMCIENIYILRL